jgi:hypothetical protein
MASYPAQGLAAAMHENVAWNELWKGSPKKALAFLAPAADESGQQRVEPPRDSACDASSVLLALPRSGRDVEGSSNFAGLAASDREDTRLVRPAKSPGGFSNIQARTLRSAHCLIAKFRIGNSKLPHQIEQLASDLIRNQPLVGKHSRQVRHRRPPSQKAQRGGRR